MTDLIDQAIEREEELRQEALRYRKPTSGSCEDCGKPAAVLHNGVRCRWCKPCMAKNLTGDLDALL